MSQYQRKTPLTFSSASSLMDPYLFPNYSRSSTTRSTPSSLPTKQTPPTLTNLPRTGSDHSLNPPPPSLCRSRNPRPRSSSSWKKMRPWEKLPSAGSAPLLPITGQIRQSDSSTTTSLHPPPHLYRRNSSRSLNLTPPLLDSIPKTELTITSCPWVSLMSPLSI
jgi:hypothetical protein